MNITIYEFPNILLFFDGKRRNHIKYIDIKSFMHYT